MRRITEFVVLRRAHWRMLRSQMHLDRPRVARWVVPIGAIVAVLLAATALAGTVLADTPTPNPLDPVVEPPVDPLGNVSGLIGPVIAIGVLIVLVAGLFGAGIILSRIGGRPAPTLEPSGPAPSGGASLASRYVPSSLVGRGAALVLLLGAGTIGGAAGREVAASFYEGGVKSIGGAFLFVLLGLMIAALGVPGLVARARRHQMSPAIATVLATAALLAIGAIGGSATYARVIQPAPLQSTGRMEVQVSAGGVPFRPSVAATSDCTSDIAGATVASVSALDSGELGPGTMRASVGGLATIDRVGVVELFIDGADVAEGSAQPSWNAPLHIEELGPNGLTGRGSFEHAELIGDPKMPASAGAWPAVLSGTISWTCDPFP